ncbi:MAG: hypothetical protein RIK87_23635 [Fuerstiella sp.]
MIIQCSQCAKKLKVPDTAAGKKVKCPGCANVIAIPATTPDAGGSEAKPPQRPARSTASAESAKPPARRKRRSSPANPADAAPQRRARKRSEAPRRKKREVYAEDDFSDDFSDLPYGGESDYDDYEENPYAAPRAKGGGRKRGGRRGRNTEGLGTVGTGLLVQGWAFAAIILMAALMAAATATNSGAVIAIVGIGFLIVLVGAGLAMLAGELMCLAAPAESGAKGLIIAAVSCHAIGFVANLMQRVGEGSLILAIIGGLSGLAFFVLFLLFLKTIARYAGYEEHAARVTILLIGIPVCWLLGVGGLLGAGLGAAGGGGAGVGIILLLLFAVLGIAALVFFVMYVNLLFKLGADLRRS